MSNENKKNDLMERIVSLCKRRGFVFPGSDIYGGMAGMYDFGPYGVELVNNIKSEWWKEHVQRRENYFGLDSAMFKDPRVWDASGHTSGFSDPLSECKKCNTRIRVDKELEKVGVSADEKMTEQKLGELFDANKEKIKCPKCGGSDFTPVRAFNLLVKTNMGDFTNKNDNPVYLPGEACQGIYLNFKNVVDTTRAKVPFGIAQIGKAFRNEISPRNFLFRAREFEQADTQYFIRPNENKEYTEKRDAGLPNRSHWKTNRPTLLFKNKRQEKGRSPFRQHATLSSGPPVQEVHHGAQNRVGPQHDSHADQRPRHQLLGLARALSIAARRDEVQRPDKKQHRRDELDTHHKKRQCLLERCEQRHADARGNRDVPDGIAEPLHAGESSGARVGYSGAARLEGLSKDSRRQGRNREGGEVAEKRHRGIVVAENDSWNQPDRR
jgi:hypothetical protein